LNAADLDKHKSLTVIMMDFFFLYFVIKKLITVPIQKDLVICSPSLYESLLVVLDFYVNINF